MSDASELTFDDLAPPVRPMPKPRANWVCTQNPFYVISALLVLWGLQQSVLPRLELSQVLVLWGLTATYTVLIAVATVLVIRVAKVWADARTLLLIIPMFCCVLSMLFDEFIAQSPAQAIVILLAGLCFSVLCFESVLLATRIHLATSIKFVYYLFLVTLYAYPVITYVCVRASAENSILVLSLYPLVFSLIFVLLIPTIPSAKARHHDSGTPYLFPLFPYSLFALLLLVAAVRFYLLALSFSPGWNYVLMEPRHYSLFVIAAGLVLLELGRAVDAHKTITVALSAGMLALVFAHLPSRLDAKPEIMAPSALVITTLSLGFYTWASLRSVARADFGVALTVASLLIEPATARLPGTILAMGLAGAFLAWRGYRLTSGSRVAVASALLAWAMVGLATTDVVQQSLLTLRWTCLATVALHVVQRATWLDRWRDASFVGLVLDFTFTAASLPLHQPSIGFLAHGLLLLVGLAYYGWCHAHALALSLAIFVGCIHVFHAGSFLVERLAHSFLRRGLPALLVGLACLAIGLMVTFRKASRLRG